MSDQVRARDVAKWSGATIAGAALALVVVVAVGAMWVFGFGFFQRSTAEFRGRTGQIERTRADANYRIANYDWFFTQCGAVRAQEARMRIFAADTTSEGRTNLRAVEANRASLIEEYNARATQEDTAGHFRSSHLPYQLSTDDEETRCAT